MLGPLGLQDPAGMQHVRVYIPITCCLSACLHVCVCREEPKPSSGNIAHRHLLTVEPRASSGRAGVAETKCIDSCVRQS